MKQLTKEEKERMIFEAFMLCAGLQLKSNRKIESRPPPEPDIRCDLFPQGSISFELVEVLDEDRQHADRVLLEMCTLLRDKFNDLDPSEKRLIRKLYGDASFQVSFETDCSKHQRDTACDALLGYLSQNVLQEDAWNALPKAKALRVIHQIYLYRGVRGGPYFSISAGGAFDVSAIAPIKRKFDKSYETNTPIELLAYYDSQSSVSIETWINPVISYINANLKNSPFRKVWIYDHNINVVLFEHPNLFV